MPIAVDQNDELLIGFIDESCDALADLPLNLRTFRVSNSADAINSVFRAVHSIKGNAGFFGLLAIKKFSHALENTLDDARHNKTTLTPDLERALVDGIDILESMLNAVREGQAHEELDAAQEALLERVKHCVSNLGGETEESLAAAVLAIAEEMAACGSSEVGVWAEGLLALVQSPKTGPESSTAANTPTANAAAGPKAITPALFAGQICQIGGRDVSSQVAGVAAFFAGVDQGAYQPAHGEAFQNTLRELAAAGDAELTAAVELALRDFKTISESPLGVDPPLMAIVWDHLNPHFVRLMPAAAAPVAAPSALGKPSEGAALEIENAPSPAVERRSTPRSENGAPADASTEKAEEGGKSRMVRVREEKLDQFLDDVARLFVTIERLKDLQARMLTPNESEALSRTDAFAELAEELRQINSALNKQSCELQQSVVALRKVPVRGLFQKFPRMTRTLALNLGKQINVHLLGEEVEIDKGLAEDLDAPLTHMVRNVCDHGIETPADRQARGASAEGNLYMKAELTRTHVVITIQDDGRGIDPARLRRKAVEKGVMGQAEVNALSDEEAIGLIFHPGFSTAEQITEVSGRGVGLDVVRTRLREHDGDVKVESQVNVGTTFRLEIPIRQAVVVVESLLVKHDNETFVLPFENIREIVDFDPASIQSVHNQRVAQVRGVPYSAVTLHELLGLAPLPVESWKSAPGVLIGCKQGQMILLVEQIVGQRKVVVNALDKVLPGLEKISGVAQLGCGKMAMVLSSVELVKQCRRSAAETSRA